MILQQSKHRFLEDQKFIKTHQLQALFSTPRSRTCTDHLHDRARVLPRSVARRVFLLDRRATFVGEFAL